MAKTFIIRHRRENLKKCSLRGLEKREDFQFFSYPNAIVPILPNCVLLTIDAPQLTEKDSCYDLLLLDGTWRYAEKMQQWILKSLPLIPRSLPTHFLTAYPRRQEDCQFPERGLASIEALYLSFHLMKRDVSGLLDGYHWKEEFLIKNQL